MNTRRIIPLSQVNPERRDEITTCFYCYCPKHAKKSKAVAAVETTTPSGQVLYYGICGNHAEVYPFTEEEKKQKPMVCVYCFPKHSE